MGTLKNAVSLGESSVEVSRLNDRVFAAVTCHYLTTPYYATHRTECSLTGSVPKCFARVCSRKRDVVPGMYLVSIGCYIFHADVV